MSTISSSAHQVEQSLLREDFTPDPEHVEAAKTLMMMSRSYYHDLTAGNASASVPETTFHGGQTKTDGSPMASEICSSGDRSSNNKSSMTGTPDPGSPCGTEDNPNPGDISVIEELPAGKMPLPFSKRVNESHVSTTAFARASAAIDVKANEEHDSSLPSPPEPTIEAMEKAEVEADILMHNQRIQDFLALEATPTYTPTSRHQFIREWARSYCLSRLAQGHPKLFTCASHLIDGEPCTTGQEYGGSSLSRPCIATFFGHNKMQWLQVPTKHRIVLCRKHYQTGAYKGLRQHSPSDPQSYQFLQLKLLRAQVDKIAEWRPDAKFTVQLNAAMQKRVASYHKVVSQGATRDQAAREVDTKRKGTLSKDFKSEEKTSVEFALWFDGIYGRHDVDIEGVLDIFDFFEEQLKSGHLEHLPPVEFLLHVRPEDRARESNSRVLRLEREREKMELPEELKPGRRLSKGKQVEVKEEDDEGDEGAREVKGHKTLLVVKRKRTVLGDFLESKKGKTD